MHTLKFMPLLLLPLLLAGVVYAAPNFKRLNTIRTTFPTAAASTTNGSVTWWQEPNNSTFSPTSGPWGGENGAFDCQVFQTDTNWYCGWNFSVDARVKVLALPGTNWIPNQWHMYALTWSQGRGSIFYMDGKVLGTNASAAPSGNADYMWIGAQAKTNKFDGSIADFRIYKIALTAAQLKSMAAGANITVGLSAWWPLYGTTKLEPDLSGNRYLATSSLSTFPQPYPQSGRYPGVFPSYW